MKIREGLVFTLPIEPHEVIGKECKLTIYRYNIGGGKYEEELLAYNINDIFTEGDMVVATKQSNSKIIAENNYITYR